MKTTDNQNEIFDVVDQNDNVIGQARRGKVHQDKKLIHRSVYILIYNSKGELFMHQRSETKDTDPLFWTVSASGHVTANDSYEEAAKRELFEELGVKIPLKYINKLVIELPRETEMTAIFRAMSEGPFRLHPIEIKTGKFFSRRKLSRLLKKKKIDLSLSAFFVLKSVAWI